MDMGHTDSGSIAQHSSVVVFSGAGITCLSYSPLKFFLNDFKLKQNNIMRNIRSTALVCRMTGVLPAVCMAFSLHAQVLNSQVNYRADVRQVTGQPALSGTIFDNNTIFRLHVDTDGVPGYTKINDANITCYRYGIRSGGMVTPPLMQQTLPIVDSSNLPNNRIYDISVWAFGKHWLSPDQCIFQVGLTANNLPYVDRYDVETAFLLGPIPQINKTKDGFVDRSIVLRNSITAHIREFWRYVAGTSHTNALDFGTLDSNRLYTHINQNTRVPDLPNLNGERFGYRSNKGNETPEVNYRFTLDKPAQVTISTDYDQTNFDTRIVLSRIVNGQEVFVAENDNLNTGNKKSRLQLILCDGTYNIYVEGGDESSIGRFELSVQQSPANIAILAGTITGPSLLPVPREDGPAFVSIVQPPSPPLGPTAGVGWQWQQNEILSGTPQWNPAEGKNDSIAYLIPATTFAGPSRTLQYRRAFLGCAAPLATNSVQLKSVAPNGSISGRVSSKNGQPVQGITISVRKRSQSLPGSPQSFVYSDTTAADGTYTIPNIYYGDPTMASLMEFAIWPSRPNRGFDFDTLYRTLRNTITTVTGVNFIDTTVFAITGHTFQQCTDCHTTQGQVVTQNCPLDSVDIFRNGSFFTRSGFLDPPGEYGQYAITVGDPGNYRVSAAYRNHVFSPVEANVAVAGDVGNINFRSTTTRTISGTLLAGCQDFIGTATLEFTDILPNDADGNPRASCFRKRITTQPGTGMYSITLPARKYRVKVLSFTPQNGSGVTSVDLRAFFDQLHPDSLIRDITENNATLNLVYERPPTLLVSGFPLTCTSQGGGFSIFPQNTERDITIQAYQGPVAKGCPASDTNLIVSTNIQGEDTNEEITIGTDSGRVVLRLKAGIPNLVGSHRKVFQVVFTDRFGRPATANVPVVVTGLKNNIGTFATVSPEIPLMVLHDPPGDASFSFWETAQENEIAMRMYNAKGGGASAWAEVKLGLKFEAGIGFTTESAIWGSIKGSVGVNARNATSEETVITTRATSNFSTSDNEAVVGGEGDVFIGAAFNMLYAVTNELKFDQAGCSFAIEQKLLIAPDSFATQYIYTESHIRNTLVPALRGFSENTGLSEVARRNFANQVKVWEQALENNEKNKALAVFERNISFDGSAGPITNTLTTTTRNINTIEFDMEINTEVAMELGLEVGGSGASGGVVANFKVELGNSTSFTNTREATFGYTLDDDDPGDFYSVNIKRDPVYNSPLFELVAATTSCPYEPGSQPRDEMQLLIPEPVKTNIPPAGEAEFILKIGNTSQSEETRTYRLSFVQASNPSGAVVTIGGSPAIVPIDYTISYLGQVQVIVKVRRGASNIFSYEGLQFQVTDACDGSIVKTGRISAFFQSQCSEITLALPEENWVLSAFENNRLPLLLKDYQLGALNNVSIEYAQAGTSNWTTAFTLLPNQISTSINGTELNWNVTDLSDGAYHLRVRLVCSTGTVFSTRVTGIIDRQAPLLLGRPAPTTDRYRRGDAIEAAYNEALDCTVLDSTRFSLTRLSDGQAMRAHIGCFDNRVVITPIDNISAAVGDSFRVTLRNVPDRFGNRRLLADTWSFVVHPETPPVGLLPVNVSGTNLTVLENSGDTMRFRFILPQAAPNAVRINYLISGTGVFEQDYRVFFENDQPLAATFDGAKGVAFIRQGAQSVTIKVVPVGNTFFEPDKFVTLNLVEGGDYLLGNTLSISGRIVNDDVPTIFVFNGSGNFNVNSNWDNSIAPPNNILNKGDEIIIDPASGECILNVPLTIRKGAKITVAPGKKLILNNNVVIKEN